jgi:hypothetical protein
MSIIGRGLRKRGNTCKYLMFPKLHMTRNTKTLGFGIITTITFLSEIITKKTTEFGSWFKFGAFVCRKSDKTNTTKNSK